MGCIMDIYDLMSGQRWLIASSVVFYVQQAVQREQFMLFPNKTRKPPCLRNIFFCVLTARHTL